jgi:peptidoglycan/LPS O-acetylase OafA/YrhL
VITRRHDYGVQESMLLAAVVAGTVLRPAGIVGRILENSAMRWVGRLSYGLYLWQQLFLIPGAHWPLAMLQRLPWNLIPVFLVAVLSYELVERPMIRLGHRLAPPPTPGRTDLASETTVSAPRGRVDLVPEIGCGKSETEGSDANF